MTKLKREEVEINTLLKIKIREEMKKCLMPKSSLKIR